MAGTTKNLNELHQYSPMGAGSFGSIAITTATILPQATASVGSLAVLKSDDGRVKTSMVQMNIETNSCRVRMDGTNPTASVGELLGMGRYYLSPAEYAVMRIIPTTGTANITIHQFTN